ncbi:MAG TPA: hypothetical protein VGE18_00585 [Candidatus Paceibacterota bacterium]
MNTSHTIKLSIAAIALLVTAILIYSFTATPQNPPREAVVKNTSEESIEGCYVLRRDKDVYTLKIDSHDEGKVAGTLAYKNFQKDSSSGSFEGTYEGETLRGYYSFTSEGTDSVREVIFKKTDNSFIQGFGPAQTIEGKEVFVDPTDITYEGTLIFVSEPCS